MRGLPDSAVYGTYKRIKGKKGRSSKSNAYYQENADSFNNFVSKCLLFVFDKKRKN